MFTEFDTETDEIEREGRELGEELAAALVLASRRPGADNDTKRQMAQIVLREIATAVKKIGETVPGELVKVYEAACRAGVSAELQRNLIETGSARHAA
jgi:hypothetical protein